MDSLNSLAIKSILPSTEKKAETVSTTVKKREKSKEEFAAESDAVVLSASLGGEQVSIPDEDKTEKDDIVTRSLNLTAEEIVAKINERLRIELPEGVQSLAPEDVTPEATAERIVQGSVAFFDIFAQQNGSLGSSELLDKFMSEIRRGIKEGYDDAFKILDSLGALKFEGVQAGIEETKKLIDEKLIAFEKSKREDLGLAPLEVKNDPTKVESSNSERAVNTVA